MRLRKKKGRCHRKCGNSCIYAETTLETYVKLKICSSSVQHKYEELLKCITPYHSEGDMYKYDFPFKKLFFNSLAVKYIDIRSIDFKFNEKVELSDGIRQSFRLP